MWVGESLEITVQRNAVTPIGFEIYDEIAAAPLNVTGVTLTCNVSPTAGTTPVVSMAVSNVQLTIGAFDVTFDGRALDTSFPTGRQEAITLACEILATDNNGPVVVTRGTITLIPGVSN